MLTPKRNPLNGHSLVLVPEFAPNGDDCCAAVGNDLLVSNQANRGRCRVITNLNRKNPGSEFDVILAVKVSVAYSPHPGSRAGPPRDRSASWQLLGLNCLICRSRDLRPLLRPKMVLWSLILIIKFVQRSYGRQA